LPIPPPPRSTLFPYTTLFRSSPARQRRQTVDLFRRQFVRPDAKSGPASCRSGTRRLGEARRRRASRREDAMVFVSRNVARTDRRSEEHTSELQSRGHLVCRLL